MALIDASTWLNPIEATLRTPAWVKVELLGTAPHGLRSGGRCSSGMIGLPRVEFQDTARGEQVIRQHTVHVVNVIIGVAVIAATFVKTNGQRDV